MSDFVFGLKKDLTDKIVSLILEYKKLEKIVIYGSRARGDFKKSSDIDIAIFAKDWTSSDTNIVKNTLDDFIKTPLKIDVVNFYRIQKAGLKNKILKEGKVLYGS
jgi:predicted nucleotidyltransferase